MATILKEALIIINKNRLYLTRVTLNSTIRLTNLWSSNSRSNWNLEMLVFEEREKTGVPGEKPLGARTTEPTTNSTHI